MSGHAEVEDQIERLKLGNTLPENEVKALCEKVRRFLDANAMKYRQPYRFVVIDITQKNVYDISFAFILIATGSPKCFSECTMIAVKLKSVSCTDRHLLLLFSKLVFCPSLACS